MTSVHPDVVVLIAGKDGRAGAALRSSAALAGADIRFLGHRGDVAALLAAADAFCFPSEREGFGGVLIEAMAAGCPVVASSIPTTSEVLGVGDVSRFGLPAGVGDPVGMGAALTNVLSNPQDAAIRAHQGRMRFQEHFTVDRVTDEMVGFFERVESADTSPGPHHVP